LDTEEGMTKVLKMLSRPKTMKKTGRTVDITGFLSYTLGTMRKTTMAIGSLHHDKVCHQCGQTATPEGHDPCLDTLPGVKYACCGHGIREGYIAFENGVVLRFYPTRMERYFSGDYENPSWKLEFPWGGNHET
jgi:hypothetical protein